MSFVNSPPANGPRVGAISLVLDQDWPPRAVTMRVLDLDGREFQSAMKGDTTSQRRAGGRVSP
jgi:hypothetical protein